MKFAIGQINTVTSPVLQVIERDWQAQLASFVIQLPPFEQALAAFRTLLPVICR